MVNILLNIYNFVYKYNGKYYDFANKYISVKYYDFADKYMSVIKYIQLYIVYMNIMINLALLILFFYIIPIKE